MPNVNTIPDSELPAPTRPDVKPGGRLPSWWKRATSYALRRAADAVGGGRSRTQSGEGASLLRERRNLRLGRAT
jgi:hypothetical protein